MTDHPEPAMRSAKTAFDREPFHDASILITGGTGSVGRRLVRDLLASPRVRSVTVLSRDDFRQAELREQIDDSRLRCVIDDITSPLHLRRCCEDAQIVIHAAAMKTVRSCESTPERANLINVGGTINVLSAAVAAAVPLFIGISSDKAVHPVNVYGATKLMCERLLDAASRQTSRSRIVCVRLCNVVGSRGGIVARLLETGGCLQLTHPDMTRFFMSERDVSSLIAECAATGLGGEIFVPRSRSARIADLMETMTGAPPIPSDRPRHAERLAEWLVGPEDYLVRTEPSHFVVSPRPCRSATTAGHEESFRSDSQQALMDIEELREFLARSGVPVRSAVSV